MSKSVGLVIVDDHVFMRDLMARTIARQKSRYSVLASVGTAAEAIAACGELKPDLLILDINLPDENGIDTIPKLKRIAPDTRVLLCTGFPTDDRITDLASTGAHGFVEKTNTWDEFLKAVERVSHGEFYFHSRSVQSSNPQAPVNGDIGRSNVTPYLTARETEVVRLIAQGLISKEIASKLHISVGTVETHRTNLMTKLNARNVAGLVAYAFRARLVKHDSHSASLVRRGNIKK